MKFLATSSCSKIESGDAYFKALEFIKPQIPQVPHKHLKHISHRISCLKPGIFCHNPCETSMLQKQCQRVRDPNCFKHTFQLRSVLIPSDMQTRLSLGIHMLLHRRFQNLCCLLRPRKACGLGIPLVPTP